MLRIPSLDSKMHLAGGIAHPLPFSQHQEKGDSFLARLAREFSSFSRTAGEATMPVGAFYGQDGGELARRVRVAAWLAGQRFFKLEFLLSPEV